MKVSLNWLRDYVSYEGDVNELERTLTFAGVEVEGVERTGIESRQVVVARIASSEKHPDADRLSVCQVEDGTGELRQIVCGAKNYKVGDKVPLALPGAELPGGLKIKKGKLRGVASNGMLCSGSEVGIPDGADGLLILPEDIPVGTPLADWVRSDTVLDIEVTPNRPDLLSYTGIAREVAALTGAALQLPTVAPLPSGTSEVTVATSAPDACPFYTATRIRGVRVGPSPDWLAEKLRAAGLRPINVVVDITNFVLLETGQPLHAFDAAKVSYRLEARFANAGESIIALDGHTYQLGEQHLVIADSTGPVAVAGVMGGEATGVAEATSEVLLESAYFAPEVIRTSGRSLGLASDSSYRFERGVNPADVEAAAARATALILELAGGEIVGGICRAGTPPRRPVQSVTLRDSKVSSLMGYPVGRERLSSILTAFGLEMTGSDATSTTWHIPSHRGDLEREIDLIEEIARVEGLDKVPVAQTSLCTPTTAADRSYDIRLALARYLAGFGFYEARTLTLVSEAMIEDDIFAEGGEVLRVRNPLGEESAALRPSLLPALLQCAARNVRLGANSVRLFEIGRVFHAADAQGSEESTRLALVATGDATFQHWSPSAERLLDIFDLKGALESLPGTAFQIIPCCQGKAALAGRILADGVTIGFLGQVAPARARQLDIKSPLLIAEITLDALEPVLAKPKRFQSIPKFPSTSRDIAFIVPESTLHADVVALIKAANEPLLSDIRVFDIFTDPEGKKVPVGHKSVAYSLTFASPDRTLTSDEANTAYERIRQHLKNRLQVTFRE